jgi:hypothetical protein
MASYVVMEPPSGGGGAEAVRFVCDRFAFFAFLVPFIWFLWHRMWIEAVAVFALALGLGALSYLDAFAAVGPLVSLLISILIGLEASALRIAALERRGWRMWGVVEADSRDDAERRYLAEALAEETKDAPTDTPPSSTGLTRAPRGRLPSGPAMGLFGYPGR